MKAHNFAVEYFSQKYWLSFDELVTDDNHHIISASARKYVEVSDSVADIVHTPINTNQIAPRTYISAVRARQIIDAHKLSDVQPCDPQVNGKFDVVEYRFA